MNLVFVILTGTFCTAFFISDQAFAQLDSGTVTTDVGNYPNNAYFQDHGASITITDTSCNPCTASSITVQLSSTNPQGSITTQFVLSGTNTYVLPTNFVYFTTKLANQNAQRPALLVTCSATGNTKCDTVTVQSSTISLTGNTFNIQSNNTDSISTTFPANRWGPQPALTADLNYPTGTSECTTSTSGDGICDNWKTANGLVIPYTDANGNTVTYSLQCGAGTSDPTCPQVGHKDVYIEMDYLENQAPPQSAIANVVQSFSLRGITLHVLVDEQINHHYDMVAQPSAGSAGNTQWDYLKKYFFGTAAERNQANCVGTPSTVNNTPTCVTDLLTAKRQVFHYVLVTHNQPGYWSGTSENPGNDIDISLGAWAGGTGTADDFAGTFMHELGHNLGLSHGGGDNINCKPNYLSVMSWSREFSALFTSPRQLNYSLEADPVSTGQLNEGSLDETAGLQVSPSITPQPIVFACRGIPSTSYMTGTVSNPSAVDWDLNNNAIETGPVACTIHYIPQASCTDNTRTTLSGYDDWDHLKLDMWNGGSPPSSMFDSSPPFNSNPFAGDIIIENGAGSSGICRYNTCINPPVFQTKPGDTITWYNQDFNTHILKADFPLNGIKTIPLYIGKILPGTTLSVTVPSHIYVPPSSTALSIDVSYRCVIHPWIRGEIIIG